MKKAISFLLLAIPILTYGQFNYTVNVFNGPYTPLTTGTVVSGGTMWDDEYHTAPIGFNFSLGQLQINTLSFTGGAFAASDTEGTVSGFFLTGADLYDRGNAGGSTALSPVRYELTGTAGSRIFKMEVYNAGFWDEYDLYTTNNDSVCFQIWLYEGTNVVELRFGPSKISHPADYFFLSSGNALLGYVKNIDFDNGNMDKMYYLTGTAAAYIIDSTTDLTSVSGGLNIHPANGTVFRFTPKPVNVNEVSKLLQGVDVVNTLSNNTITVKNNTTVTVQYRLISSNGTQTSINGKALQGNYQIDISNLPAGMYILQCYNADGMMHKRIVKQ